MTRSYNGMLIHTNSLINILIYLYFDLNSMFYYVCYNVHTSHVWQYTFYGYQWDACALVLPTIVRGFPINSTL
jgi:hypothetical protein